MKNRKGFTLIELLVAITIIGIIMLMVLPAITNLQRENQKKKFDDYERAVLEAAKAYEDQYEEDLFGRYSEGCAYIDYKSLVEKKLLNTTKISGYECNYDTNGIIIRKVNGKSFYEVYLDCIKNGETKKLTGNSDYTTIKSGQCDIGEDKEAPTLEIKCDGETNENSTYRTGIPGDDKNLYYRGVKRDAPVILPKLTVKAKDTNSGLEKNQYVTYEWKIYTKSINQDIDDPNSTEKNKTTFNTKDGAGSTAEKKVRIIEAIKQENETGIARIDLYGDNIVDRAGNKRESISKDCTYYYDNAIPEMEIKITGNNTGNEYDINSNTWINEPITTTVTVTDKTKNNTNDIYSGIDMDTFENSNISGATLSEKDETTATHTYTLVDTNRKAKDKYKVCDKVGNCISKTVTIRVDTTYPTCKSRGGNPNWRNQNLTIYGECIDQGNPTHYSDCRQKEYQKEYSNEISIKTATAGEACDNAGNCIICSEDQDVHIDKTLPNCTTSGESAEWATSRTINFNCDDPISNGVRSGCTKNTYETVTYTKTIKTSSQTWNIKDNAGNSRTCTKNNTVNVYMDNTEPLCIHNNASDQNNYRTTPTLSITCREKDGSEIELAQWVRLIHGGLTNFDEIVDNSSDTVTSKFKTDGEGDYGFICENKAGLSCVISISVVESTCTSKCCGTHDCRPYSCHCSSGSCDTCYHKCPDTCTSSLCCGYHEVVEDQS